MAIMSSEEKPIALKEVQLRLGVPQHVLIHLCEKGVVVPDFAEALGRGKRREFSERNVFEFAVALALREFEMPVATAAFVVRLTRAFERATAKLVPGFALPGFLVDKGLDLTLRLYDGGLLVFDARGKPLPKPLLLSVAMGNAARDPGARPRLEKLAELPTTFEARFELNLSRIARRIARAPLA
jgi:hypothetical protein